MNLISFESIWSVNARMHAFMYLCIQLKENTNIILDRRENFVLELLDRRGDPRAQTSSRISDDRLSHRVHEIGSW